MPAVTHPLLKDLSQVHTLDLLATIKDGQQIYIELVINYDDEFATVGGIFSDSDYGLIGLRVGYPQSGSVCVVTFPFSDLQDELLRREVEQLQREIDGE